MQFRKFRELHLDNFHPRLNIIVGNNAWGKTSILESLSLMTQLKSFRTSSLKELIQHGETSASVSVQLTEPVVSHIHFGFEEKKKTIKMDGKEIASRSKYPYLGASVSFIPDDLYLVKGSPEARRNFLDDLCIQLDSEAFRVFALYDRVLKQRNRGLKAFRDQLIDRNQLAAWNEAFVQNAVQVYEQRVRALESLSEILGPIYYQIFQVSEDLKVHYENRFDGRVPSAGEFQDKIRSLEDAEIAVGYSLVGPHRDDLSFSLGGLPARSHASQGQTRSLVISLKVCQIELAKRSGLGSPILLLDDIISELDEHRVQALVEYLANTTGQLFVTTAETAKIRTLHERFSSFQLVDLSSQFQRENRAADGLRF